ncbi:MAG: hypothetical protein K6F63_09340 [Lachnospiraceae bacterium]|nr:hypothetical protein [Lachnospiraceae bacterium]
MRKRRTRDIVIELTSLLDVVMILIFAVMIENSKMVEASEAEVAAANVTMEEMRNELDESEAEKARLTEDYTVQLENKDRELQEITIRAEETNKELDKAKEDNLKLSEEKDEISKNLQIAERKLSEGEVEELLKRIENAEKKLEGYEYLSDVVAVYNIGVETIYSKDSGDILYRILTYGKSGTSEEDELMEFTANQKRDEAIELMCTKLATGIDESLKAENANVYVMFTYHDMNSLYYDTNKTEEALKRLVSQYDGKVYLVINEIKD